jgi:hypothetical protein
MSDIISHLRSYRDHPGFARRFDRLIVRIRNGEHPTAGQVAYVLQIPKADAIEALESLDIISAVSD